MGLAYRSPKSRVIAYEMDCTRFDLMRKFVGINHLTDRVAMDGECTVLKSQFTATHAISLIEEADVSKIPPPENMNWFVRRYWSGLAKEGRDYPTAWMHLVPRTYTHGQDSQASA